MDEVVDVISLESDPFVQADIAIIQRVLTEMIAGGVRSAPLREALELTASLLETNGVIARAGGRVHLYGTCLDVSYAMQRAQDLRLMVAGW